MEYFVLTKKGDREVNEDFADVVKTDKGFCCILADGLGGHDKGEVASKLVTDTGLSIFQETCQQGNGTVESYMKQCFMEAQDRLMQKQQESDSEMKTTMVVLASLGHELQWGHVGDSRLYQFDGGKLVVRTLDHSVPQMLVMAGEIKEKDIRRHEDRNRLLRVMGTPWNKPNFELADVKPVGKNQAYLLCSDGFWELIEEKQMIHALNRADSPRQWLELMEEEVLRNGCGTNMDNYTAIGVFLEKTPKKSRFFGLF